MRVSEVAARTGTPATTLRYYETVGLLTSVRDFNGYRNYDDSVFERLRFIEAAKQLDLPLPQIADLLVVVEGDTCTSVREAIRPRLDQQLAEVETRLRSLRHLRNRLAAASRRVAACPDSGERCATECMLADLGAHDRDRSPGRRLSSCAEHRR